MGRSRGLSASRYSCVRGTAVYVGERSRDGGAYSGRLAVRMGVFWEAAKDLPPETSSERVIDSVLVPYGTVKLYLKLASHSPRHYHMDHASPLS